MEKLSFLIVLALTLCSFTVLADEKAPQDKIGSAAASAADNAGKGASQLGSDVSKGTGTILDGVGKYLQELGRKLGGSAPAPAQPASPQAPAPQTPSSSAQQSETSSPTQK